MSPSGHSASWAAKNPRRPPRSRYITKRTWRVISIMPPPWFGKLLRATLHRIARGRRQILRPCAFAALHVSVLSSSSAVAPCERRAPWNVRDLHSCGRGSIRARTRQARPRQSASTARAPSSYPMHCARGGRSGFSSALAQDFGKILR
jgi:hypothetical protein